MPCRFGSGLEKFALDPILVIFFKIAEKITSGGLINPNFSKDRINLPLVIYSAFLKKYTRTGSSHFLSPNGQGSY